MEAETEEQRAERELKKRKRLSDAASEALNKIAKEDRRAEITDLPEELFNRNILGYLDLECIKRLNLDDTLGELFNMCDYWCLTHDCFMMDNGALKGYELADKIEEDGLDGCQFFERLRYRNHGDWLNKEDSHPDKEVLLDFDPLYRPYLQMARRCPRCEIHAMKLVLEGMPQIKEDPKCGRCLEKLKNQDATALVCSFPECGAHLCNRCRKLTCNVCNLTFCKYHTNRCDICSYTRCLSCSESEHTFVDVERRWVRYCLRCEYEVCHHPCDPNSTYVFDCSECEEHFCHDCKPSLRCQCGRNACSEPCCRSCVTPVARDDCGRTFRQGHVQNCNQCGGNVTAVNQK